MKVILNANWFVEGRRYRKSVDKHDVRDIPDHLEKQLPKRTVIVEKSAFVKQEPDDTTKATQALKGTLRLGVGAAGIPGAALSDSAAHAAHSALAKK